MSNLKSSTADDTNPISAANLKSRIDPLIDKANSLRELPDIDPRKVELSRVVDQINSLRALESGETNQFPTTVAVAREQGADATLLYEASKTGKSFPNEHTFPFQVQPPELAPANEALARSLAGTGARGVPTEPVAGQPLVQESHVDPVYQPPNPPNNPPETATVAQPWITPTPPDIRNLPPKMVTPPAAFRPVHAEELLAKAGTTETAPLKVPASAKAPKKTHADSK